MTREIDGQRYLTMDEAARRLKVSSRTLKNWLKREIVSAPAEIQQGLRTFLRFTDQWVEKARRETEEYRKKQKQKK